MKIGDTLSLVDYSVLTDEELVELAKNECLDAQESLFLRYKNLIKQKSKFYFMIGSDKDDIIQEGMFGLYKAVRSFDISKNANFYPFANMCITRQIISATKSAKRQKHFPLNSYISLNKKIYNENYNDSYIDTIMSSTISNPEELFICQENKTLIENFINTSLSPMETKVLALYLQDLSYIQISAILGKKEKSIDNAIQRIRYKILKNLK